MPSTSLYVHIPFCSRKCLFCSFTIAVGQEHRRENYARALVAEMEKYRGQRLKTVYFGGGTPTLMDEEHFDILIDAIRKKFSLENDFEMTVEANPEGITAKKAAHLKTLGFNRVSLGVQSLNGNYLRFLGRGHDAAQARAAYAILREAGFSNINLDLMYGFPGQTAQELQEDVNAIASMGSEHLSLYTLTIEPNSRFHALGMKLDDEEKQAEHYLMIAGLLQKHGFEQYEVSNFARAGHESLHNRNYWQGGSYIALGLGAHDFDGRRRSWRITRLQDYLERAAHGQDTVEGFENLSDRQLTMEKVLFGLRMNEGVPEGFIPADRQPRIKAWIKDGFLKLENGRVKATDRGRLVLDELSSRLV